ncbi:hypothetical protein Sgly_2287 [Syntrophobotulus glycolicus DSM 8271]|uniref:DUF2007 domain-containing protein n=1 Tax=Syntrophobotulus glycolicus (strain DSM 8271 / FlGlyR) TaxID=645991 RepID=F0SUC6_SYNGF|nr:hypothetical protein [Syntrophobotulus glycolicus]ADY56576.1 hypothetical protein Sgly_2287 [Syntrophobotulus glycolicus DSM 8271]
MPWCPKCKTEYRDEFQICSDCGSDLVEEAVKEEALPSEPIYQEWLLLVNCADNYQTDILESFLQHEGLETLRKYPDIGDYTKIYTGMSLSGADLYVKKDQFIEAQEIVKDLMPPEKAADSLISDPSDATGSGQEKDKNHARLFAIVILFAAVAGLFGSFWQNFSHWFR